MKKPRKKSIKPWLKSQKKLRSSLNKFNSKTKQRKKLNFNSKRKKTINGDKNVK